MIKRLPLALTGLLLATAACTAPAPAPVTTTAPPPVTTVTSPAPASPSTGAAAPSTPAPAPATTTTTVATTAPAATTQAPAPSGEAFIEDDRKDYIVSEGQKYAFESPTGNLACAFVTMHDIGCQAKSVVANLPQCSDPSSNGPLVHIAGTQVVADCTHQGIYMAKNAKKLDYGHKIVIAEFTCTSQTDGVRCFLTENPKVGFLASMEYFGDPAKR